MEAPSPLPGVTATPPPPAKARLTVPMSAPVVDAPSPWPRAAQGATAACLALALGLLGWHACGALRWGARPTEPDAGAAGRIDLNHADRPELLQLPGVGEITAERIEEYRRAHNGFRSVEELRQVRGVGPALVERLRPLVEVKPTEAADEADAGSPAAARPLTRPAAKGKKPAPPALTAGRQKRDGPTEPINVNEASADELQQLPGVGPTLSARIIQARERRPFQSVDELRRVKGIGVKTLEALRPFVRVD
jgi:competence protein ComEA